MAHKAVYNVVTYLSDCMRNDLEGIEGSYQLGGLTCIIVYNGVNKCLQLTATSFLIIIDKLFEVK